MSNRFRTLSLLFSLLIACVALVATAEIGEEDPCREACREEKRRCVQECSEHSSPIECDSRCQEAREDCELSCD
jgi:hypothetical protein